MNPLVSERKENPPILIVDRQGQIGESLSENLFQDTQVVLVSQKRPKNEKFIFIPFERNFPIIPQSTYSHIFVIDDESKLILEALPSFLKKASENKSTLIIIINIKNQRLITDEYLDYKGTKIVYLGDIVDKNIYKSIIARFLNQARLRGRIELPGEGMDISYPVFFEDVVTGILEAAFGTSPEKIFYLFPKDGISFLAFAHLIQKANPTISIDFAKEEKIDKVDIEKEGKFLLEENYPLEEKVRAMKIEVSNFKNDLRKQTLEQEVKYDSGKNIKAIFFFLTLFIFLPFISTLLFSFLGTIFLGSGKAALRTLDFDLGGKYVSTSEYFFGISNNTAKLLSSETFSIGLSKNLETYLMQNYEYTRGLTELFQGISFYSNGDISKASNSFKNFLLFAQKQKANKKELDFISKDLLNLASGTVDTWPQILGFKGSKKYLILFQNNSIMRASGGVVQAYGVMDLDKGKIKGLKLGGIEELDSKLTGHVEPPFAIRRYLKSKDLFLKDSNFDPDFREVGQSSSYIFSLETGQGADGVLAADLNFIKRLLTLTGPLELEGFEKIDEKNLFAQSQRQALDSKFLVTLLKEIQKRFEDNKLSAFSLLRNIDADIKRKNILIVFPQKNIQNAFTVNGFSNALWDERKDSQKDINDFLGFSESNFGEANFIERQIKHNVEINSSGQVNVKSEIELNNRGGAEYKTYLRIILPKASKLKGIKLDQEEKEIIDAATNPTVYEGKNFKPKVSSIEVESESKEREIFGLFINIPKGQAKIIEFAYELPTKPLSIFGDFKYSLIFFKQPGVDFYPFNLEITFPKEHRVLSFPKEFSFSDNKVFFAKDITEDLRIDLDFSKK